MIIKLYNDKILLRYNNKIINIHNNKQYYNMMIT